MLLLVSYMSEIRPVKDYPESGAMGPDEMRYGMKSVVGSASVLHPKRTDNKGISRLRAERDVCKGSTDTPEEATQGCSATLNLIKRFRNPLRWRQMRTDKEREKTKRNPTNSFMGGCQFRYGSRNIKYP